MLSGAVKIFSGTEDIFFLTSGAENNIYARKWYSKYLW
jgi:hypothetical protein